MNNLISSTSHRIISAISSRPTPLLDRLKTYIERLDDYVSFRPAEIVRALRAIIALLDLIQKAINTLYIGLGRPESELRIVGGFLLL
jgi:hypothetical protein